MSRIEKVIVCILFLAACIFVDATERRIKVLEANLQRTQEEWKTLWTAADETFRAKELQACGCNECRRGGTLPKPGTPLLTARVHNGEARIAWIDEKDQRQERTMTEKEFCRLNAKPTYSK